MDWKGALGLSLLFVVYLCTGAAVFQALESHNEVSAGVNYRAQVREWLGNYTCVDAEGLTQLVETLLSYQNSGIDLTLNGTATTGPYWDYVSSLFFSITVVTTIGYGHISPSTSGGQVFLVFYAVMGIPLCGLLLATVGDKMGNQAKSLEGVILARAGSGPERKKQARVTYLVILVAIAFGFFMCIPALMFTIAEGWNYGISFYYSFVTLSTIGFGDYVAGTGNQGYRAIYKVMLCLWIFLGLAWFALVISLLTDSLKGWGRGLRKKVKEQEGKSIRKPVQLNSMNEDHHYPDDPGKPGGSEDGDRDSDSALPNNAVTVVGELGSNGKKSNGSGRTSSGAAGNVQLTSVKPVDL